MKKLAFFFIAIVFSVFLFATEPLGGVHSVADFEKLYTEKIYPFDKISDTTFQRLKSGISFDDEKRFRGFIFIGGLRKELTFEEYQKFNELISGEKMIYSEDDKVQYEIRRNRK